MPKHIAKHQRQGVALVAAIALIAVVSTLLVGWTRGVMARRATIQQQRDRQQAVWLVEAGLRRAAARYAASGKDYAGETWLVPGDSFQRTYDAELKLAVEPTAKAGSVEITAAVEMPPGEQRKVRLSKTIVATLPDNAEPSEANSPEESLSKDPPETNVSGS